MANTSAVYARIDSTLKENAEGILQQLGISPSSAIQMLYSQIVLTRGLPLDLRLPAHKISAIGGMNRAELNTELQKGIDSLKLGKIYTLDEVDDAIIDKINAIRRKYEPNEDEDEPNEDYDRYFLE